MSFIETVIFFVEWFILVVVVVLVLGGEGPEAVMGCLFCSLEFGSEADIDPHWIRITTNTITNTVTIFITITIIREMTRELCGSILGFSDSLGRERDIGPSRKCFLGSWCSAIPD